MHARANYGNQEKQAWLSHGKNGKHAYKAHVHQPTTVMI